MILSEGAAVGVGVAVDVADVMLHPSASKLKISTRFMNLIDFFMGLSSSFTSLLGLLSKENRLCSWTRYIADMADHPGNKKRNRMRTVSFRYLPRPSPKRQRTKVKSWWIVPHFRTVVPLRSF